MKTKSAKDLAFDKERAKYRKEIRELNSMIIKQRIDIDKLKQDIDRKDMELLEKDEWIRRLLEYMDMSEEDMRKIIQKDKTMAEAAERLSDINKMVSRFFGKRQVMNMLLKVISTGSQAGNCYALIADNGEILLLDFGCEPNKILQGIGYRVSDVCGACLTHSHGDHVKAYRWLFQNGISIYTNDETAEHFEIISGEKMIAKPERIPFEVGSFRIVPFYVPHDGCPCYAYIISHPECGNIIYATDMSRIAQVDENYRLKMVDGNPIDWSFKSLRLSHMIIEANYDFSDFADIDEFKRSHVGFGHHSLQQCKRFVEENKTPGLRNVILVHLSKDTDEENIRSQVQSVAGKWVKVAVAHAGDEYVLSKYPWGEL